jgi:hypothetical protein
MEAPQVEPMRLRRDRCGGCSPGVWKLPVLLLLVAQLGGCVTAMLLENVAGRPDDAPERGFAVELQEAFIRDDGILVLVGHRDTPWDRQTWAVRVTPTVQSAVAVPWNAWYHASEPSNPVVLQADDGASDAMLEDANACSFAGRMREEHRSIPVYAAGQPAPSSGEAVILKQSPIRLSGRDARTAQPQIVVIWSSTGERGSSELGRTELSFLEDVRSPRPRPAYLWLLPFSLAYDAALVGVAPPVLAVHWAGSSDAPPAEAFEAARQKGCRCLTRAGGGEISRYWTCYEPRLL